MEANRLRGGNLKVVLDTNMLTVPFQFKVDILEEIWRLLPEAKIYTVPQVIRELRKMLEGSIKERLAAKVGLKLLEKVEVLDVDESLPTDTILLKLSEEGYIIATNDRELRRRIRERGGSTIYLRERNHLEMD